MVKVTLNELKNAGPKQTNISNNAVKILENVLNSTEFSERVRNNKYTTLWRKTDDGKYNQATADQLLELILSGKELKTEADFEIDLYIKLAKKKKGILGSTPVGGPTITTAYWFINDCIKFNAPVALAAHWMHEWLHTAGFYHLDQQNDDFNDAPYDTGEIVESIGRTITLDFNKMTKGSAFLLKDIIGPAITIGDIVYETGRSLSDSEETMM